jgi:hypothetical protein
MAIVAMALLWTGSQIPVYLYGMINFNQLVARLTSV